MKYRFEKVDEDTTKLIYKDKEFEIKKDVELTKKIQSIYLNGRTKMMVDLAKQGISKKDLVIEKKEDGKTYYDNSNVIEIENTYIQMASVDLYNDISKKYTGMELQELMEDIGLNETDSEKFGEEFSQALHGKVKTPSKEK